MSVDNYTTKIIITTFMDWFSRITVNRYGEAITPSLSSVFIQRKNVPVPIQWASREKWSAIYNSSTARKVMDPAIREKNPVEMQWVLPRISVFMNGINYDATRKLTKTQRIGNEAQYVPAPYNFDLEVYVVSKTLDDNLQIMEQILPYFAPELSLSVKLQPGLDPDSVPIVFNGVTTDIPVDFNEDEERLINFSYNFTVKSNFYPKKRYVNRKTYFAIGVSGSNQIEIGSEVEFNKLTPGTLVSGPGIPNGAYIVGLIPPSTVILSNGVTADFNSDIVFSGKDILYSLETTGCSAASGADYIKVIPPAQNNLKVGMLVWGEGIPDNTYIVEILPDGTIKLSNNIMINISNVTLHFGINPIILDVKTNMYASGSEYIQVDQQWIAHLQKIEEKFNYFVDTSTTPNPFFGA